MRKITFYSYKGGTGRSLSLANAANVLACEMGRRVGVVDLDFEAAALHDLFSVDPGERNLLSLLLPRARSITNLERHVLQIPPTRQQTGALYLLPSVTDSNLIDDIHWDVGAESFLSVEIFPALERLYGLDYLLLDARSGVSSFATFALRVCDLVVLVCRADRQNRTGMAKMSQVCRAAGKPFLLVLSGCPSPERHRRAIEEFSVAVGSTPEFVLPYLEELYFNEALATRTLPASQLAKRYRELAERLALDDNQ